MIGQDDLLRLSTELKLQYVDPWDWAEEHGFDRSELWDICANSVIAVKQMTSESSATAIVDAVVEQIDALMKGETPSNMVHLQVDIGQTMAAAFYGIFVLGYEAALQFPRPPKKGGRTE